MSDLRMDAYYYSFCPTGVPEIDKVLSAVACAGKAFHYTQDWIDETDEWPPHTGTTAAEWIQNAANEAAAAIRQARDEALEGAAHKADTEFGKELTTGLRVATWLRALKSEAPED